MMERTIVAAESHRGTRAPRGGWLSDFAFDGRAITVRKTGATTRLDAQVLHEVAVWMRFYLIVRIVAAWRWLARDRQPVLRFATGVPRPWYFIRSAAVLGGVRIAGPGEHADAEIAFDDSTWTPARRQTLGRALNFGCTDIAKSTVAQRFATVFGYPLAIDPATQTGVAVEKGEINSMHDGRIVACPRDAIAGRTYQRLIDTEHEGIIQDLRTSIVGGRPVIVCVKSRKVADRFRSIDNIRVDLERPGDVFSLTEVLDISRFCAAMGLDWGTLDILRDRNDGRIYVVDVNKTDVGPVLALSLADQLRATGTVGLALARFLNSPARA